MNDIEKMLNYLKKEYCEGKAVKNVLFPLYLCDAKIIIEAIENLIQRNKELEEIEKEHKEENGRLREENKNLEKELEEKDMQHEFTDV